MQKKKNHKEIEKLYGIRLYNEEDIALKKELEKISKKEGIPLQTLILLNLKKSIDLENNGFKLIDDDIEGFFTNLMDKISHGALSLESALRTKDYGKKESLRNYVYNKYPNPDQRNKLYLELLNAQIHGELELLKILLLLTNYQSKVPVGYMRIFLDEGTNPNDVEEIFKDMYTRFMKEWIYILKLYNAIEIKDDLSIAGDYSGLEALIFK